jgi:hypothetical protein
MGITASSPETRKIQPSLSDNPPVSGRATSSDRNPQGSRGDSAAQRTESAPSATVPPGTDSKQQDFDQGIFPHTKLPSAAEYTAPAAQANDPDLVIQEIKETSQGTVIDGHLLRNTIANLLNGREEYSQIFPELHFERRWAIDEEHSLNALIARLQERLAQVREQPSAPVQTITPEEYETRRKQIEAAIDLNEKKQLQSQQESDRADAHFALIALTRSEGALGAAWIESRKYFDALQLQTSLRSAQDLARAKLQRTEDYLLALDDAVNSALLTTDTRNRFRTNICFAFSGLIAAVIIGFFVVAQKDEGIRRTLFASGTALQFVTIFCLIIAIILFGVVNILEGRELAALLGGLSGYILGRGNLGGRSEPAGTQNTEPTAPKQA